MVDIQDAYSLQKQATEYKEENDYESAIKCLREAIRIKKKCKQYFYTDSIRLAKYVYASGNKDGAWRIYHQINSKLATEGDLLGMSNVSKAMALQVKREKRPYQALYHYIESQYYLQDAIDKGQITSNEPRYDSPKVVREHVEWRCKQLKIKEVDMACLIASRMMLEESPVEMAKGMQDLHDLGQGKFKLT